MLRERVFVIGGALSMAAGVLLLAAFLQTPVPLLWGALESAVFLLGFGAFFIYVGNGARRDRERLLESPRPPS